VLYLGCWRAAVFRLQGFAGSDTLTDSLGRNVLEGGSGNDTLIARDTVLLPHRTTR
jgi:Ca2+-binding RTX toxin-like protein